jgi:hypothetical protein
MIGESQLEIEVKKPSKFAQLFDQFKQCRQEGAYFDHYLINCIKIVCGYRPIDYRFVSHENAVVHSFIHGIDDLPENKVSPDNHLVGARFVNVQTGKYE